MGRTVTVIRPALILLISFLIGVDCNPSVRDANLPTTSEVGETVGCKYRTTYDRLGRLEERGEIKSRKIGNLVVWMKETNGTSNEPYHRKPNVVIEKIYEEYPYIRTIVKTDRE